MTSDLPFSDRFIFRVYVTAPNGSDYVIAIIDGQPANRGPAPVGRQNVGGRFSVRAATPSAKSGPRTISSSRRSDSETAVPTSPWRSA